MKNKGVGYVGSRVMHSIIGYKLAEELALQDRSSFLHGSIAPDAISVNEDKNTSHFFSGHHEDHSRTVDFQRFFQKYRSYATDQHAYILGYYTHLIADDVWLKGFYLPWLRNRMDADESVHAAYHNDFKRLNGKLLHYYKITEALRTSFSEIPTILELDEIPAKNIEKFIPYVLDDMDVDPKRIDDPLHVFTLPQIIGYIETSIELGRYHINAIAQRPH